MKQCIKCKEVKEITDFHKHKGMKDGHLNKCAVCVYKDVVVWRLKNQDCRKKEHARNRAKNNWMTKDEWKAKVKKEAIGRKTSLKNYAHKRRLQTKVEMTELDSFVFAEACSLAEFREKVVGGKWHVDHIVPLNHKKACGLHNAFNLQVVPADWNVRKGNRNMDTFDIGTY